MSFDFDKIIDRRNTNCVKWDKMETLYGVSPDDGISMWVADMDFKAPPAVNEALAAKAAHGVHGYFGDDTGYKQSIIGWMERRHGWTVDPEWITTVHGLVSGVGFCLQAFTKPGDGIILFTPVYHAFHRIIKANDRVIHESPMKLANGLYEMDLDALAASLTERDRAIVLCSPHNPGGRVWTREELKAVAEFCVKHDLLLLCDEIHHDLVFPGHKHLTIAEVAPEITDRLVVLTAASKSFNLSGGMTGNVIIPDADLRVSFQKILAAAGQSPNALGVLMTMNAYNHGEEWLDELILYLDGNRRLFDAGINEIPGVRSMELQSTYLSWVDFSGTGMNQFEIVRRVQNDAKIAANHGPTFGTGGENFMRFNFATQRSRVEEAVERLQRAFSDLQ